MNTLSYAKYSDGVKTHVNAKKLFKTRQRSILGAFVVSSSLTTIDPNALLMRKDNSRIFNVDEADVQLMQSTRNYTREKAIAYYEAVTQIPQATKNVSAYTNAKHDPPGMMKPHEMTKIPKIIWYANSWIGNSWVQNLVKTNGGIPCFWTKDHAEISDPFSKAWKIYESKFPKRGWRVTYDIHKTKEHVFEQLMTFLEMYSDMEPQTDNVALDETLQVIILPAGTGKTTYSKEYDKLVDIDDIINVSSVKDEMKSLRRDAVETNNWSQVNKRNGELVKDSMSTGILRNKILLAHGDDMFGNEVKVKVLGGMKLSKEEMIKVRDERAKDDEMWAELTELNWNTSKVPVGTREDINVMIDRIIEEYNNADTTKPSEPIVHVWIQGTLNGRNPQQTVTDLKEMVNSEVGSYADGEVPNEMIPRGIQKTTEYMQLWETPLSESQDLWESYGGRSPMRIPVIPWRVSNLGLRSFNKGIPPQLFPASSLGKKMKMSNIELHFTEVYCNYSSFVEMVQLDVDDIGILDYGWLPVGVNLFTMATITEGNFTHLLKVSDPDFFRGCGSVVTSSHACFGIGRTNDELIFRHERKVNTSHGTSGHMIASVLAFQSQFLWYLQEVFDNFTSNKSVYIAKFKEPESGVYHTIHEYRNAIHDMKRVDSNKLYPKYARNNFEICKKFVSLLKV